MLDLVSEALQVATTSPTANTTGTATTSSTTVGAVKQEPLYSSSSTVMENISSTEPPKPIELDGLSSDQFAKGQDTVAIEGFTDEENTESGGEGQYRERDGLVVVLAAQMMHTDREKRETEAVLGRFGPNPYLTLMTFTFASII